MKPLALRLARLEQAVSSGETVYLWADTETLADQAIAARFPDGVPSGTTLRIFRWADADQ